jgi:hypothetical protein
VYRKEHEQGPCSGYYDELDRILSRVRNHDVAEKLKTPCTTPLLECLATGFRLAFEILADAIFFASDSSHGLSVLSSVRSCIQKGARLYFCQGVMVGSDGTISSGSGPGSGSELYSR